MMFDLQSLSDWRPFGVTDQIAFEVSEGSALVAFEIIASDLVTVLANDGDKVVPVACSRGLFSVKFSLAAPVSLSFQADSPDIHLAFRTRGGAQLMGESASDSFTEVVPIGTRPLSEIIQEQQRVANQRAESRMEQERAHFAAQLAALEAKAKAAEKPPAKKDEVIE